MPGRCVAGHKKTVADLQHLRQIRASHSALIAHVVDPFLVQVAVSSSGFGLARDSM